MRTYGLMLILILFGWCVVFKCPYWKLNCYYKSEGNHLKHISVKISEISASTIHFFDLWYQ